MQISKLQAQPINITGMEHSWTQLIIKERVFVKMSTKLNTKYQKELHQTISSIYVIREAQKPRISSKNSKINHFQMVKIFPSSCLSLVLFSNNNLNSWNSTAWKHFEMAHFQTSMFSRLKHQRCGNWVIKAENKWNSDQLMQAPSPLTLWQSRNTPVSEKSERQELCFHWAKGPGA